MVIAITAADDCTIQVMTVPAARKEKNGEIAARVERGKEVYNGGVVSQVHIASHAAQHYQRPEKKSYSKEEIARHTMTFLVYQHHSDEEGGKYYCREVQIVAQRHYPRRQRGAYVCSHDDRYRLCQREQSCRNKRNRHYRCCRRRLYGTGYHSACQHTAKSVARHSSQYMS